MAIFSRRAGEAGTAAEDRSDLGPCPPIHPRLRPVAEDRIERLRVRLRAACDDAAEGLQAAVAQLRVLAAARDVPRAQALLNELEKALSEIDEIAVSELFDAAGLASLTRRLTVASDSLRVLRGAQDEDF